LTDLVPAGTTLKAIENRRSKLKLYTICDSDNPEDAIYAWWEPIWAPDPESALAYARENYGGECHPDDTLTLRVVTVFEPNKRSCPLHDCVHREPRMSVCRDAGWRNEIDTQCDACGLWSLDSNEWLVCGDCNLCPECRDGSCAECHNPDGYDER
jgi:hypothetical protein